MGKVSHVSRTNSYLREQGFLFDKVEKHIPHPGIGRMVRKDCFGFFDILAVHPVDKRIVAVQVCGKDFTSHVKKIVIEKRGNAEGWLRAGGEIMIIGWSQDKKSRRWKSRIQFITLDDMANGMLL